MTFPRRYRIGLALVGALAVAAPVGAMATKGGKSYDRPPSDQNRLFYATNDKGSLLAFTSRNPDRVRARAITGLPMGVSLKGIDFRPRTGDLYGVGSDKVVYRVNPATAIAVAEGPTFETGTVLASTNLGVDFNPTVDKIRVTSDADDNLRLDPDTGTLVPPAGGGPAVPDAKLNPAGQKVAGSAYANSGFSATLPTQTILYAISTAQDRVHVQAPPNAGTLDAGKPLGRDFSGELGFDIAGKNNVGYIAGTQYGKSGARLYSVDVTTGRTWNIGRIGDGSTTVTGLAAYQDLS